MFPSKFTYWQCIKRQYKATNNCKCYIKIEKFEEGSRNMIVKRQGGHDESHSHNHTPDFAHQLKKDLNEELRRLAVNNFNTKTSDLITKVLEENADFQHFFETNSSMPSRKSMMRTVQRARQDLKPPTVRNLDFFVEIQHIKLPNFFRGEVQVLKARHFIFFSDCQLAYMAKAHCWYIDGTFKIVKDNFNNTCCTCLSSN